MPSMAARVPVNAIATAQTAAATRAVQRHAEKGTHRQPSGEVTDVPQRARRPDDGPYTFPDVIGGGGQERVPAEILRDAVSPRRGAGDGDAPQNHARISR